jgi:hypothetical protein
VVPASRQCEADLAYLPGGLELAAGADLSRLMASAAWRDLVAPVFADAGVWLAALGVRCGIAPSSIARVTVGVAGAAAVVVLTGPPREVVQPCLEPLVVAREPARFVLRLKTGGYAAVAFPAPNVTTIELGARSGAQGRSIPKTPVRPPAFDVAFAALPPRNAAWVVAVGGGKLLAPVHALAPFEGAGAGLDVSDGLLVELRARFATVEAASRAAALGSSQRATVQDLFALPRLDIGAFERDVGVVATVPAAQLGRVAERLRALQAGALGGMTAP